jgi:Spy/CpxP family protein refolding chaperone
MKTKLMILMTATLLAATALVAQRGPWVDGERGPSFDALVSALELTEAQLTSLQENSKAGREAMRALFEEAKPLHEQIRAELDAEAPNAAVVGELTVQLDAIRDQIGETKEKTHADALAVLTPGQQEALTAIVESKERSREKFAVIRTASMLGLLEHDGPGFGRRGGHRGPGGPGGPEGMHRGRRGPGGHGGPGGPPAEL